MFHLYGWEDFNIIYGIVLLECAIKLLKGIRNSTDQLNKLITCVNVYSLKIEVDRVDDFQRHHRKV